MIASNDFATGYGFNFGINNAFVAFVSLTIYSAWVPGAPATGAPAQLGTSDSISGVAGPNIHFATLVYSAVAPGVTRLSFNSSPSTENINDGLYTLNTTNPIDLSTFIEITVLSEVPEPATFGISLMALAPGVVALRRRRTN